MVEGLESALLAIDRIVEQGEGNSEDAEDSHYRKFCSVRDEYKALLEQDPGFEPARPVVHHPVQRRPPVPDGKVHIEQEEAAALLDLGNAMYNHVLRTLGVLYEPLGEHARQGFMDEAIGLMLQLVPLNEVLTRLPAHAAHPMKTAGMSFAVTREIRVPPADSALALLSERLEILEQGARALAPIDDALATIADGLESMAKRIAALPREPDRARGVSQAQAKPVEQQAEQSKPAAPMSEGELEYSSDPSIPPRRIIDGVEVIEGSALTLRFDTKRCIHARFCVLGAPTVFVGNVQGPWIRPDAIDPEALVAVAHRCPSGAITYERKTDRPEESAPPVNTVHIREHGPLAIAADLHIEGATPRYRAVLCRCGASKPKPFCDGSHSEIGFQATGEPPDSGRMEVLEARDGKVHIRPLVNGPLDVQGNLEICTGTGHTISKVTRAKLCRCGGSKTKPFCDGSHRSNGFSSVGTSEI